MTVPEIKPIEINTRIFQGEAEEVEKTLQAFLHGKAIKINGFTQSQSTIDAGKGGRVIISITLLYTEYPARHQPIAGFTRDEGNPTAE